MALKIQWTLEAADQLEIVTDYLEMNWTKKELESFFRKLEKGIETVSKKPLQQKKSKRKEGAYEYQLSRQSTIFYSFDDTHVTIHALWSNRMNPDKL